MFTVSDSARNEIKKVLASKASSDGHLVIYFQGQGCAGPSLGMALDGNNDGLETIESNGITAYIDPRLNEYLAEHGGIDIDYQVHEESGGAGYLIQTGKQASGESCGGCSCT